ncbi:MAG TPA: ferrochelatase [Candidatus Limosilactobacillus intestinipullorum]|nr:ferrochelatase [Candidatus Limosilactobacillus intestinipullorum]
MKQNGLLLVNLGSPAAPTTAAVKHYLSVFLGDHNVVTMPPALWQPLLKGIILPLRAWRSATFYQDIWTKAGSPLIVNSQRLATRVQDCLPDWDVRLAMTYEQPAIADTLTAMKRADDQVTVLSLFPHFTQSTTQSIIDQVRAVDPTIKVIDRFGTAPAYLKVLADQIQRAWEQKQYDRLLISYHGIPAAMVKHGDPYQEQTTATTAKLRQLLDIPDGQVKMVYQSKFGPLPWLKPYLKNTLLQEAQLGHRRILIAAPSFVTDCLETLEEDGVQNYQAFRASGGQELDLVPALNDRLEFAQFIADLARKQVGAQ